MKKKYFTEKIQVELSAGFLKLLIERLANEERAFDMAVRRIRRGIWQLDFYTCAEYLGYFQRLLNVPPHKCESV